MIFHGKCPPNRTRLVMLHTMFTLMSTYRVVVFCECLIFSDFYFQEWSKNKLYNTLTFLFRLKFHESMYQYPLNLRNLGTLKIKTTTVKLETLAKGNFDEFDKSELIQQSLTNQ